MATAQVVSVFAAEPLTMAWKGVMDEARKIRVLKRRLATDPKNGPLLATLESAEITFASRLSELLASDDFRALPDYVRIEIEAACMV